MTGLPIRKGTDCRLDIEPAENLKKLSRKLRGYLQASLRNVSAGDLTPSAHSLEQKLLGGSERGSWLRPDAIPTLLQLLMAEARDVRLVLVKVLSAIPGKQASVALAQRALYDLDPSAREAAVAALRTRNPAEYQDRFVQAFQYPWPPVADHAAEAVVALRLTTLVPKLIPMLECTDPSFPVKVEVEGRPQHILPELVRINHLSNCVLCHPASFQRTDLVRGRVPDPAKPLPPPIEYYESPDGDFVQANKTYLKQDFSVPMFIERPGPWPSTQRFDLMVSRRPISNLELTTMLRKKTQERTSESFPQRESLLFALRKLTGKDPGNRSEDWLKLLKKESPRERSSPKSKAIELSTAIVKAPAILQEKLLNEYRAKAGEEYSLAIAQAIPQLPESSQKKGRESLADRLAKLPASELRKKLRDPDEEMRAAAILAAGKLGAKELVPDLIPCLDSNDAATVWTVRRILFSLTNRDFGPALDANEAQRKSGIEQWQEWWRKQSK